ncbi:GNAT family N-acetyltransferase [Massilia sp. W12]|uniref:GNAT family N-acetyltransferase n=1 Tax=Massilia sp. W12 TaxID=3126507 RepID=UPI0030D2B0D2
MTAEFQIRAATPQDIPAILGMIRELAEFEQLSHLVKADEAGLHDALFGERPVCEALVGIAEKETAAFALYYHNFSTFVGKRGLYLEDLYVKPAFRSFGLGRDLLVELARIAVARGCGRFDWSVLDWNQNAIDFYQGLGAQVLPDWRICRLTGAELEHLAR